MSSSILDKITQSKVFKTGTAIGKVTYGYITERLWPVYSVGMVFGTMFLIASMHEKQIIADCLLARDKPPALPEETSEATLLMEEEVQHAVKLDVFRMPSSEFSVEAARLQI